MFKAPERYRKSLPRFESDKSFGNNGLFFFRLKTAHKSLISAKAIISDGMGWEHVSVSLNTSRSPTWDEMCQVKALFWDEDDAVVQYHPAKKDYVNYHPYTLHLWRPTKAELPAPPPIFIGPK